MTNSDKIYADILNEIVDFKFDEQVVSVFPDMINRSVPGYSTVINMIGVMAGHVDHPGARFYDLGCSLGAASLSMSQRIKATDARIIAVDNAPAMIARFKKLLSDTDMTVPIELHCADIVDFEIAQASMVVLNYTLQFIDPDKRMALLQKIYDGMESGGILVLSEKISFDEAEDEWLTELHHAFKKANHYSDLEISQKRSALENILRPEPAETHLTRLQECGFKQPCQWFQCFNFVSFIAVK